MSAENPSAHVKQFLLGDHLHPLLKESGLIGTCTAVFVTVLHSIAVVTTCLRLWVRIRLHRLWWEDAWAALALCLDVICAVSTWILTLPEHDHPWYMSRESHIISVWLTLFSYTSLIWASRMSILFSLIRTVPGRMRRIAGGFAVFFILLWALCATSKAYACGSDTAWYNLPNFPCPLGLPIAIIELTTNVVSGIILVALPALVLWGRKLHKNERVLVLSIFSMCLLSAVVSIVHVAFLIPVPGFMASVTADIEGAVNLVICNLLVLVSSAYRFFRNGDDIESSYGDFTTKSRESSSSPPAMDTLTTVDLERLETMSIYSTKSAPTPQSGIAPIRTLSLRSSFDVTV